jgi:hypothetical protein
MTLRVSTHRWSAMATLGLRWLALEHPVGGTAYRILIAALRDRFGGLCDERLADTSQGLAAAVAVDR